MNRKGFTLVELLVTVAVMGIITGLSIPVIRNISQSNTNKKYTTYLDSLIYASKLYTDSYSEDLFGRKASGCSYIKFDDLEKYNLVKDIDMGGTTCDTPYTMVKVTRFREKYYYKAYIGCGKDQGSRTKASLFLPKKVGDSDVCNEDFTNLIGFTTKPSNEKIYKVFKPIIKMRSETGISPENDNKINYGFILPTRKGFSTTNYTMSDINFINGTNPLTFNIYNEARQLALIENGDTQWFSLKEGSNIPKTPIGQTGNVYMVVHVVDLVDLDDKKWKKIEKQEDNYVILGPYLVDNTPPVFNMAKVSTSAPTTAKQKQYNCRCGRKDKVYRNYTSNNERCPSNYKKDSCRKMKVNDKIRYKCRCYKEIEKHIDTGWTNVKHCPKSYPDMKGCSSRDANITINPFNNLRPKININVTDTISTAKSNLKMCWEINNENHCGKPNRNDPDSRKKLTNYVEYTSNLILNKNVSNSYDGSSHPVRIYVADAAGNWTKKDLTYKVAGTAVLSFDPNGGSECDIQSIKQVTGARWKDPAVTLSGYTTHRFCSTTKPGYKIDGWYTGKNGTGTQVTLNSVANSNLKVYAHWVPRTFTVSYDGNGADGGSTPDTVCTNGQPITPAKNGFTRTGYDFVKWDDVPEKCTEDVELEAVWKAKTYTVSYNGNGNTGGSTASTKCTYGEAITPATNGFTKTGHDFSKWDNVPEKCTGNVELKAVWTPKKYTVSYNGNGNTGGSTASTQCSYGSAITPATNGFTKTGYHFDKWTNVPAKCTGNVELKASWLPNTVTISFDSNGGTGSKAPIRCTYNSSISLGGNTFSKTGHSFNGWSPNLTKCPASNTTVKPLWKANVYTVYYNGNGATSGSTAASNCTYGQPITTRGNGFKRNYFHFTGWSAAGTCTGNKTLYAQWSPNIAYVQYHTGSSSARLTRKPSGWRLSGQTILNSSGSANIHAIAYGKTTGEDGLINPQGSYLYIRYGGRRPRSGSEWRRVSGCASGTYKQGPKKWSANSLCNTINGNCTCVLRVNWR